jgi:hypothetical protein
MALRSSFEKVRSLGSRLAARLFHASERTEWFMDTPCLTRLPGEFHIPLSVLYNEMQCCDRENDVVENSEKSVKK